MKRKKRRNKKKENEKQRKSERERNVHEPERKRVNEHATKNEAFSRRGKVFIRDFFNYFENTGAKRRALFVARLSGMNGTLVRGKLERIRRFAAATHETRFIPLG